MFANINMHILYFVLSTPQDLRWWFGVGLFAGYL